MPKNEPLFSFVWEGDAAGNNQRYKSRSNKHLSEVYAGFMDDIAMCCRAANPGMAARPITRKLFVLLYQNIHPARDADSLVKPVFDGIEKSAVIGNDNKIRNFNVITTDKEPHSFDRIEIKAYLLGAVNSYVS